MPDRRCVCARARALVNVYICATMRVSVPISRESPCKLPLYKLAWKSSARTFFARTCAKFKQTNKWTRMTDYLSFDFPSSIPVISIYSSVFREISKISKKKKKTRLISLVRLYDFEVRLRVHSTIDRQNLIYTISKLRVRSYIPVFWLSLEFLDRAYYLRIFYRSHRATRPISRGRIVSEGIITNAQDSSSTR